MTSALARATESFRASRPGRTLRRYLDARGLLLAQGLAYRSIFATFAALWVAFAVGGFWLRIEGPVQDAIIGTIAHAVPGLIDRGDGGAIQLEALLSAQILGWTGAIALIGLGWTIISWFAATRSAVQAMLGTPERRPNLVILRLADAASSIGFGIAILISALLYVFSTSLLDAVLGWLGVSQTSTLTVVLTRLAGLTVGYAFDLVVLWALFTVMAPRARPARAVWGGAAIGAVAFAILQTVGAALLGGAGTNPLLTSFAVIIGLLLWFNLACQTLLLTAAWIGEAPAD